MRPSDWVQASIIEYTSACVRDTAAGGGSKFSFGCEDSAVTSNFAVGQAVRELQGKTSAQF